MSAVVFVDRFEPVQKRVGPEGADMHILDDQPAAVTAAASGKGVGIAERPIGTEVHVATSVASGADRSGPASGRYDAVVIGANALGLSLALQVQRVGTGRVRVVDPASSAALAWGGHRHHARTRG